jgi:hypothetical protein
MAGLAGVPSRLSSRGTSEKSIRGLPVQSILARTLASLAPATFWKIPCVCQGPLPGSSDAEMFPDSPSLPTGMVSC